MGTRWRWIGLIGLALIALGMVAMLASFPFISGVPGPGQEATDPSWFRPMATCVLIGAGLGIGLVGAFSIRWLILRRDERS